MSVQFKQQYSNEPTVFSAAGKQANPSSAQFAHLQPHHQHLNQQSFRQWSGLTSSISADQQQRESVMSTASMYTMANSIVDLNSYELQWLTKHFPTLSSDQLTSVLEEAQQQHGEAFNRLKQEQFQLQKQKLSETIAQQQQNIVDRINQKSNLRSSYQQHQNSASVLATPQQQQSKRKRTRAQFDSNINPASSIALSQQSQQLVSNIQPPNKGISSVETCQEQPQVENQPHSDQQNQPITGAGQVEHYISEELIKGLMNSQTDEQRVQLCIQALEYSKKQIEEPDELKEFRCKNSMLKKGIRLQAENYSRESVKERQFDSSIKKLELAKKENEKLKQDLQLMHFTQQLQTQLSINNNKSTKKSGSF